MQISHSGTPPYLHGTTITAEKDMPRPLVCPFIGGSQRQVKDRCTSQDDPTQRCWFKRVRDRSPITRVVWHDTEISETPMLWSSRALASVPPGRGRLRAVALAVR